MIRNFFRVSWRRILKNPLVSIANFLGLTMGYTCFLYAMALLVHELSFDDFQSRRIYIYKIVSHLTDGINTRQSDRSSFYAGYFLKDRYAFIEEFVRFQKRGPVVVKMDGEIYREEQIHFVDSTLFRVFDFQLLQGNPETALVHPRSILLSESMAEKYFGEDWSSKDIIGRSFTVNNWFDIDYQITGVIQDPPFNSSIDYRFLISYTSLGESRAPLLQRSSGWGALQVVTYVLVNENANIGYALEEMPLDVEKFNFTKSRILIDLIPLNKVRLNSTYPNSLGTTSNKLIIYSLGAMGFLILILAILNYINLTTALNLGRSKEASIRRVLGSNTTYVYVQSGLESILMSLVSLFLALVLALLLFSILYRSFSVNISAVDFVSPANAIVVLFLGVVVGLLCAILPASYLANMGRLISSERRSGSKILRVLLLVVQISIVIELVGLAISGNKQFNFMANKNLGYRTNGIVKIPVKILRSDIRSALKSELTRYSSIASATFMQSSIEDIDFTTRFFFPGFDDGIDLVTCQVDEDFIEVFDIEMLAGTDFTTLPPDSKVYHFIVNEELLRLLDKSPQDVLNTSIRMNWGVRGDFEGTIIGVVKDFHFRSLHEPIRPLVLVHNIGQVQNFLMVKPERLSSETVAGIQNLWQRIVPDVPFSYDYLGEDIESKYNSEIRMIEQAKYLSVAAIIISMIGLFGLSRHSATVRAKEMGIRKVFGANTFDVFLFSLSYFLKLLLAASIVAIPVGYLLVEGFLNTYAYRIDGIALNILSSALLATLITVVAVSYDVIKLSITPAATTLRHHE